MPDGIEIAFERQVIVLPLSAILPLRQVSAVTRQSTKYHRIAASIAEVGIIEPIVVAPPKTGTTPYLLLDGHIRYAVLKEMGEAETRCLIAGDDEAFTYNKRINRLATIQEHYMIVKAIAQGVSEEKLAKALGIDIRAITRRRKLLDGICPEVVDLLKDRNVNPGTFWALRKMKAARQIEAAELMVLAANFTSSYAKALLAATRRHDLVHPDKPRNVDGMSPDQMARMEREMETLQQDFKAIEASYGDDVLILVIAAGYLGKMIGNTAIQRHLTQHHPEILAEFRAIVTATSLDQNPDEPEHEDR